MRKLAIVDSCFFTIGLALCATSPLQFLGEFKALTESRMRTTAKSDAQVRPGAVAVVETDGDGGSTAEPDMTIAAQLAGSYSDRALVLCSVVHNADLANCAKTWNLAKAWTYRLMDEFCEEGDEERRLGLEVGPLNDRETLNVPKGQVGFINFIALPLWNAWVDYVAPGATTVQLHHLKVRSCDIF